MEALRVYPKRTASGESTSADYEWEVRAGCALETALPLVPARLQLLARANLSLDIRLSGGVSTLRVKSLKTGSMISAGLTVSPAGTAELRLSDSDKLVHKMRDIVQDLENLYRPARDKLQTDMLTTDRTLLALYAARDNMIEAESCILRLRLEPTSKGLGSFVKSVDDDVVSMFGDDKS